MALPEYWVPPENHEKSRALQIHKLIKRQIEYNALQGIDHSYLESQVIYIT